MFKTLTASSYLFCGVLILAGSLSWAASGAETADTKAPAKTEKISFAGFGLLEDQFPIDPSVASLTSYAEKIDSSHKDMQGEDMSWRRNNYGTCRAWFSCPSGRKISCWAQGDNCNSYSDKGIVDCISWANGGQVSEASDSCP